MTIQCPSMDSSTVNHHHQDEQKLRQKFLSNPEMMLKLRDILLDINRPMAERFRCVFTLKSVGSMEALNILAQGFNDESALLKHEIAYVMGQMADERALAILEQVLRDSTQDSMVRHEAAEAIGAISSPASLPLLSEFLSDSNDYVRETCELAIAKINFDHSQSNQQKPENLYNSIDPAPALIPTTPSQNTTQDNTQEQMDKILKMEGMLLNQSLTLFQRYRALFTLRDIATVNPFDSPITHRAIDAITNCFFANNPTTTTTTTNEKENTLNDTRNMNNDTMENGEKLESTLLLHELAYVLGQLAHPHSLPALSRVLHDKSSPSILRHECAEAIGAVGTEDALMLLKRFGADGERVVRESVEVALDIGMGKDDFNYGVEC